MSKKLFEKDYPFGFTIYKFEGDKDYTITGNLKKEYHFKEYGSNYDVEEHIQKHVWCHEIEFDSEFCQFFAYAKSEQRAIKFCDDIQDWFNKIKEVIGEDVDVEKKAYDYVNKKDFSDDAFRGYKAGYNQALEDNKGKIKNILMEYDLMVKKHLLMYSIEHSIHGKICEGLSVVRNEYIQSLQPPTSLDIEFVNGKLKLK